MALSLPLQSLKSESTVRPTEDQSRCTDQEERRHHYYYELLVSLHDAKS